MPMHFLHLFPKTNIMNFNVIGNVQEQAIVCKLNYHMSGVRQCIEHMYGALFNLFHLLKTPHQIKLFNAGLTAYCPGVISFYILYCYICLNSSACKAIFETTPQTLEQNILFDEELQVYVPNHNQVYDYHILNLIL